MPKRVTMNATWWSVCEWCDTAINAGQVQELETLTTGLRWVHPDCAAKAREEVSC